jgi:hypothetical protein
MDHDLLLRDEGAVAHTVTERIFQLLGDGVPNFSLQICIVSLALNATFNQAKRSRPDFILEITDGT